MPSHGQDTKGRGLLRRPAVEGALLRDLTRETEGHRLEVTHFFFYFLPPSPNMPGFDSGTGAVSGSSLSDCLVKLLK